ncbi:hypothetical protein FRB95_000190 [Tulasnella sp. JGI-2019a]|nr:hypothetical protein FRB95_000190 [Tulasnella sp. JGI-2019a]
MLARCTQAWLEACYEWVIAEFDLRDNQIDEIVGRVENQLLESDLDDSMQPQTGLPINLKDLHNTRIASGPRGAILCQINALTDIGHSAFSLQNVRQTRIDRADLAGLVEAGVEDEEENQSIPNYPRGMLRMELSDGSTTLHAMEYRRISALQLGVTPLGCKVLLKNVLIRRGIAFLEPASVDVFVGSQTEEREAVQDKDFARGLRVRLGKPEEDPNEDPNNNGARPQDPPPPPPPAQQPQPQRNAPRPAAPANPMHRGGAATSSRAAAVDDSFDYFPDDSDDFMNEDLLKHLADVERKPSTVQDDFPDGDDSFMDEDLLHHLDELENGSKPQPHAKPKPTMPAAGSSFSSARSDGTDMMSLDTRSSLSRKSEPSIIDIVSSDEDDEKDTQATAVSRRPGRKRLDPVHEDIIEISD